ncbi:MAG: hypothetical protein WCV73_01760 [Patescibacteria group bacterium]|jgi:hypothetical protein
MKVKGITEVQVFVRKNEPVSEGDFPPSHYLVVRKHFACGDLVIGIDNRLNLDVLHASTKPHFQLSSYRQKGTIGLPNDIIQSATKIVQEQRVLNRKFRTVKLLLPA